VAHSLASIPVEVTVALIGGTASVIVFALTALVASVKDRDNRRRDTYARAFQVIATYKEFPYVVRRRRVGDGTTTSDERARISEELRKVQADLSYFSAWMGTESTRVATTYRSLVDQTRRIAGQQIHDAWAEEPIRDDSGMNMPDLGLKKLEQFEQEFLSAASDHLSVIPWRRWRPGPRSHPTSAAAITGN
jgi:hypothetical protein